MTLATGTTAIAIEKLAHLVALSETFRAGRLWSDALAESIEWWGRTPAGDDDGLRDITRPFAVVESGAGRSFEQIAGGEQDYFIQQGHLWLYLEMDWPADYYDDHHNATNVCANYFDLVIEEVMANAGRDVSGNLGKVFEDGSGDLTIGRCQQGELVKSDPRVFAETGSRFYATEFDITWGANP